MIKDQFTTRYNDVKYFIHLTLKDLMGANAELKEEISNSTIIEDLILDSQQWKSYKTQ